MKRIERSIAEKCLGIKSLALSAVLLLCCLYPSLGYGQTGDATVDALVEMGFENVGWTEDDNERVYVLQNSAYRLNGIGIGRAVDVIQSMGLPDKKACRIIVLDNNMPQMSLCYEPIIGDTVPQAERRDWVASYDLGESWKSVRRAERKNSSLYKIDVLVYPDLSLKNLVITQIYQVLFSLSPAIEISLWRGMKLSAQVVIPVYNDGYGRRAGRVHPGFITAQQELRLPHNIWLTGTVGLFNNERFGAEYAYTIDGADPDLIEYENFNAAHAEVRIEGLAIHPGEAKGKLINALTLLEKLDLSLGVARRPEMTEGYEGFFHLIAVKGDSASCEARYLIREHDKAKFEAMKQELLDHARELNAIYPKAKIDVHIKDDYRNMKEILDKDPRAIEHAKKAFAAAGIPMRVDPIRGGTDGATFSFLGCPTPNLGTGSYNHHGEREYLSLRDYETLIELVKKILTVR